jgi:hypothetical protein
MIHVPKVFPRSYVPLCSPPGIVGFRIWVLFAYALQDHHAILKELLMGGIIYVSNHMMQLIWYIIKFWPNDKYVTKVVKRSLNGI